MERLPKETLINAINTYKTVIEAVDGKDTDYCPVLDKVTVALLEELKAYREAEEQGLLLRLPCKVGDTVYQITRDFISEYRIRNFICYNNGNIWFDWECTKGIYINVKGFHIDDIGKTVFITKEEAEQKLAEVRGE